MSINEIEFMLKKSLLLLHSNRSTSATELRNQIDEEIRRRYGADKMMVNNLLKKHFELESDFPGRAQTPPVEIINLTNSPDKTISESPNTILDSEDANENSQDDQGVTIISSSLMTDGGTHYDEANSSLRDFGDLNCCVCSEMMFTATNRLIECSKCGSLYHQACHKPAITHAEISDELLPHWLCDQCLNKPTTTKEDAGLEIITVEQGHTLEEPVSTLIGGNPGLTTTTLLKSSGGGLSTNAIVAVPSYSSSSSNSSSPFYRSDHYPSSTTITMVSKKNNFPSEKVEDVYSSNNFKNQSTTQLNPPSVSTTTAKRHTASSTASNSKSKVLTRQYESRRKSHK